MGEQKLPIFTAIIINRSHHQKSCNDGYHSYLADVEHRAVVQPAWHKEKSRTNLTHHFGLRRITSKALLPPHTTAHGPRQRIGLSGILSDDKRRSF
jgi:hypothetical protein